MRRGPYLLIILVVVALTSPSVHALPGDTGRVQQVWTARYDNTFDYPSQIATSPDGARVFVVGRSAEANCTCGVQDDFTTIAYDAESGKQLWIVRYDAAGWDDRATAVAIGVDGTTIYVTGVSQRSIVWGDNAFVTFAYDAATGRQLWFARYQGGGAKSIAVSPDGSRAYVTGPSRSGGAEQATTIAYDTDTGAEVWVRQYGDGVTYDYEASSLALSSDGQRLFVSSGRHAPHAFTVAYKASDGSVLWSSGQGGFADVSPDGSRLFITAGKRSGASTVAYDAATGTIEWESWADVRPVDLEVSPDGARLYVAGTIRHSDVDSDYATIAYDAVSGGRLWLTRYNNPQLYPPLGTNVPTFRSGNDASALAVSPDGLFVYVTGSSVSARAGDFDGDWNYATVAYEARTGLQVWVARYEYALVVFAGSDLDAIPSSIAVSPDNQRVFVTGSSEDLIHGPDFLTVAYRTAGTSL